MASSYWVQKQREAERRRREEIRLARAMERERLRREREATRQRAFEEKERKRLYLEARTAEVDDLNRELSSHVQALAGLLEQTLGRDDALQFEALKEAPEPPEFKPGTLAVPGPPPTPNPPADLTLFQKFAPGAKAKHAEAIAEADRRHSEALTAYNAAEGVREKALAHARSAHEALVLAEDERIAAQHAEVDAFEAAYRAGDPKAVVNYCSLVLAASQYPESFPQTHKVAYVPESRQLVVEFDLPAFSVVPEAAEYRYVKTKDEITTKARPATQRKALYTSVVSQVALRTVHEMFEADQVGHVDSVVFNGYVDAVDPRTGKAVRPCLITIRTSRDVFGDLDLARVEPEACLRGLSASVSRSPSELAPVRPVLEFNMVDSRFVEEVDVLSGMDERPNLMDLTPGEFEALITNLFEKMGLETRMTQASRDGGVDCVAYDARPILGGKVVIQAKRYKHTVGVSAVRDLFGTMQNEGASKGILVTTSGYGKASFAFAEGKPLELLGGSNLLYLLEEHAGIQARIEPPEDWVDPVADIEPEARV